MNIAFLTPEYPHAKIGHSGGIGTSIKSLSQGLINEGVNVRILVYGQNEEENFDDEGIIVQKICNIKFIGLSWWLTCKKLERIINRLHAEKQIDLVEAPDWTGITSFINPRKCPVIIRLHGSDTYFCHLDNRSVKWINKFHEYRALKSADGLISVSHYTAALTKTLFGLNRTFAVIHNGVNTDLFESSPQPPWNNRVLYFGTLTRKKGVLELSNIFNTLCQLNPDAELIIIGKDTPDRLTDSASTWCLMYSFIHAKYAGRVQYLGPVAFSQIKMEIEQAAVCVFPSFAEAFPLSWLEAMALQKAIVASDIGWAKEQISDGEEGFLVHPTDHKLFAKKIHQCLTNNELRDQLGRAARRKVMHDFSHDKVARDSIDFYKNILNDSF